MARLPAVVAALNNEPTRLIGKKPQDAIEAKSVAQKPSSVVPGRAVGLLEERLSSDADLRYLYQPGEQEGGRRRATDPIWSLEVYEQGACGLIRPGEPVVYYLRDGPKRGFVREELQVVPWNTELPPEGVLKGFGVNPVG